ncbi:MAG: MBL fold metallo-hydrolase [Candidatus Thorarchaeota archaeon]
MEITWLGTAGFYLDIGNDEGNIIIDPFYPLNPKYYYINDLIQKYADKSKAVFLSHGHFDHAKSVVDLTTTRDLLVFCSRKIARNLGKHGVAKEKLRIIKEGKKIEIGSLIVEPLKSEHARIDLILILRKLWQKRKEIYKIKQMLSYLKDYPKGDVFSYKIIQRNDSSEKESYIIHFWGSAGTTKRECKLLATSKVNSLLLPLYGNTWVIKRSLKIIKSLNPEIVIPHHTDDTFPPLSEDVNLEPFIQKMEETFPGVKIVILKEGVKHILNS